MAVQQTSVDLTGMKKAQTAFQDALDHTSRTYANVDGQVEALRASWTGQAATIYGSAMDKWLEDFNVVNNSLRTMLEKLAANTGVNANTHSDTEQQAQQVQQMVSSGNYAGLPGF